MEFYETSKKRAIRERERKKENKSAHERDECVYPLILFASLILKGQMLYRIHGSRETYYPLRLIYFPLEECDKIKYTKKNKHRELRNLLLKQVEYVGYTLPVYLDEKITGHSVMNPLYAVKDYSKWRKSN